ncbi:MAG: DUF3443 family protein [Neisseriales bacterium]|nr:MAG: DUF3443 family protein [Neisseriales bacterium]
MKNYSIIFVSLTALCISACNGGSSSSSSNNALAYNQTPIVVDHGVNESALPNRPFVTVTLCVPGTTTCQTIDHVLLDTGSDGLRVPASVLKNAAMYPQLTLDNQPLYTCANYAAGYDFGSMNLTDVVWGGETAKSVPFQIIDDSQPQVGIPASCDATGSYFDFIAAGQNAIIGVRNSVYDADTNYTCVNGTCTPVTNLPESMLIGTPVIRMPVDNNGVLLQFPNVPANGATSFTGTLTFGINTQSNNTVTSNVNLLYTRDSLFNASYNNTNYQGTFDSGTPFIIFSDNTLPVCTGEFEGFYCPSSPMQINAVFTSYDGRNQVNSSYPLANPTIYWGNAIAGNTLLPYAGAPCAGCESFADSIFLWGLPYFYGKTIYSIFPGAMINNESAPALGFSS